MKKPKYLFRKGQIVTITWKHGGEICKVLARPGQIVYDTITNFIRVLNENEYVVYNKLWIKSSDFLVAQYDTKPISGFLVNDIHLVPSSKYEKKLRRLNINQSPYYNIIPPEGELNEIIVFNKLIYPFTSPRIFQIIKSNGFPGFPMYELNTGEIIERGSLRLFYRKPIPYEIKFYNKKRIVHKQNN